MKTLKEENIVNISMKASELLMSGRIQPDQINGHAGMTDAIVSLAEKFEQENAGVDYDAEGRDYWLEIDAFAEENLLQKYGLEQVQDKSSPTINILCEEHEDEGGIREFFVLAVSEDRNQLRQLMEAKIRSDPYGVIATNGVEDHWNDHFKTKFNDGFVEYYILDEIVRSKEELQQMIQKEQTVPDLNQSGPVTVYGETSCTRKPLDEQIGAAVKKAIPLPSSDIQSEVKAMPKWDSPER